MLRSLRSLALFGERHTQNLSSFLQSFPRGTAHSAGFFLLRGTAHSTAPRGFVFPPSLKPPSLCFLNAFFFALSSRSVTFFASPQGRGLSVRTSHTSPYPLSSKKMRQTSFRDQGKRKKLQRSSLPKFASLLL